MDIEFKIGMIAPSGAGKTSLIHAIYNETKERLMGKHIEMYPEGTTTQQAMKHAQSVFDSCISNPDNLFVVPEMKASTNITEYNYTMIIQGVKPLEIKFSIMDYPGGLLGEATFAREVIPFLNESDALFVPISSEILMHMQDTIGQKGTRQDQNTSARMMLNIYETINAIKIEDAPTNGLTAILC